jgi:uncharacterized protein YdhG (YjbR/CyaY superfamily)
MQSKKYKTVEGYFKDIDPEKYSVALELRNIIKEAAPKAEELISYNMPAYKYQGILVYFAVHNSHIGFYPVSSAINHFKDDLKKYETSKGTIKFPLDKKIPKTLIKKIVAFRIKENEAKHKK